MYLILSLTTPILPFQASGLSTRLRGDPSDTRPTRVLRPLGLFVTRDLVDRLPTWRQPWDANLQPLDYISTVLTTPPRRPNVICSHKWWKILGLWNITIIYQYWQGIMIECLKMLEKKRLKSISKKRFSPLTNGYPSSICNGWQRFLTLKILLKIVRKQSHPFENGN